MRKYFMGRRPPSEAWLIGTIKTKRNLVHVLILALMLALATIVRTWQIDIADFKMDESGWLSVAGGFVSHGVLPHIGSVDPNSSNTMGIAVPPLMAYLMALPLLITRNPAFATGFVAMMNVLAVALVFWFGSSNFGRLEGYVAGFAYATSTTATLYSRKIWSNYMLAPFVMLFFIALVLLFVQHRRWFLAFALFLLSWTLQLHISALPLALVLLVLAVLYRREIGWGPALIGIAAGLGLWVPYAVWIFQNRPGDFATALNFVTNGHATADLTALRNTLEMVTTGSTEVGVSIQVPWWIPRFGDFYWFDYLNLALLLAGVLVALKRAWRSDEDGRARKINLIMLLWIAAPIALSIRHAITVQRFYMLPLQPALFLLIGIGAAALVRSLYSPRFAEKFRHRLCLTHFSPRSLWEKALVRGAATGRGQLAATNAPKLVVVLIALFFFAVFSQAYLFTDFVAWAQDGHAMQAFGYPPIRYEIQAADLVGGYSNGRDLSLLVPADTDTAKVFDYLLAGSKPHFEKFIDNGTLIMPLTTSNAIAVIPGRQQDLSQLEDVLPTTQWRRVVSTGGELQFVIVKSFEASLAAAIGGSGKEDASSEFANGLRLISYRLPPQVQRGQRLVCLLVFQVTRPQSASDSADYHLFNHLVDQTGNKIAQQDSSSLPLREWHEGDEQVIAITLDVPADLAPGMYNWHLGAYDLKTMKRVEISDTLSGATTDSLDLGPVSVRK